jgi:hypothetical protein
MRLNRREDIEAPQAFVFRMLADFDHWERAALRRGADVQRLDVLEVPGPGMGWKAAFRFRGKDRKVTLRLVDWQPDQAMAFRFQSPNVEGRLAVDLVQMSPRRTRLALAAEIVPRSIAARLVLQGLRLARGRVERRIADRLAQFAAQVEERWRRTAPR